MKGILNLILAIIWLPTYTPNFSVHSYSVFRGDTQQVGLVMDRLMVLSRKFSDNLDPYPEFNLESIRAAHNQNCGLFCRLGGTIGGLHTLIFRPFHCVGFITCSYLCSFSAHQRNSHLLPPFLL